MGRLFDTDVLIDYLRGRPEAVLFVEEKVAEACVSVMNIAELYQGVRNGNERVKLGKMLSVLPSLPITSDIAEQGGTFSRDYRPSHGCLLCSTGAVYKASGIQSPILESQTRVGVDDPLSYPLIRARVEDQWGAGFSKYGLPSTIARGFAFVGPRLLLDGQFAIGNFLRDVLAFRPVTVHGDGNPIRSYLHAADLAVRLWHLLIRGQPGGIFNVGACQPLTIGEAAQAVAGLVHPSADVRILCENSAFSYYVPSTARLDQAYQLPAPIPFSAALERTWKWLRKPSGCN